MAGLPPPPINDKPGSFTWLEWYRQLRNYVSTSGSVPWYIINFAGSNITDIALREHNNMQGVQGGVAGEHYHLSAAQLTQIQNNDHNAQSSLQGGAAGDYYHLTNANYEDLVTGAYGSMYMDNASVARTIAVANTYYEIASGFSGGATSQFTFQNGKELKCNRAGTYKIDWSASRSIPGINQEIEMGVFKNGVIQVNTTAHNASLTASTQQNSGGCGILTLAVNDLISLAANNNTSTNTITITHANLTVHRVGS